VFHNPYAKFPLGKDVFNFERSAQIFVEEDELVSVAPDDFLLLRMIQSITYKNGSDNVAGGFFNAETQNSK
jgi:hypothetical protein